MRQYVPAGQGVQLDAPVLACRYPAAHVVQLAASAVAYLPASQAVQLVAPTPALYWPTGQRAHNGRPVDEPYCPVAQLEQSTEPDSEDVPTPQLTQDEESGLPVTAE